MLKELGATLVFFGILCVFGAWMNKETNNFWLEIIFGPMLIYFGWELLK